MDELLSFLFQNLFLILLVALALYSFIFRFKHRNRELFEVSGGKVLINPTPKLQFSFARKTAISIDSVVKVEVHGNRLSLFQISNNAIDVWVQPEHLNSEIINAKRVFSHAVFSNKGS